MQFLENITDEALIDAIYESPKETLRRIVDGMSQELSNDLRQRQEQEQEAAANRAHYEKVMREFKAFGEEHDGFNDLWSQGKIQAFIRENEGHSYVSAYYVLTGGGKDPVFTLNPPTAPKESATAEPVAQREAPMPRNGELIGTVYEPPADGPVVEIAANLAAQRAAHPGSASPDLVATVAD